MRLQGRARRRQFSGIDAAILRRARADRASLQPGIRRFCRAACGKPSTADWHRRRIEQHAAGAALSSLRNGDHRIRVLGVVGGWIGDYPREPADGIRAVERIALAESGVEDAAPYEFRLSLQDRCRAGLTEAVFDLEVGSPEELREGVDREQLPVPSVSRKERASASFVKSVGDRADQTAAGREKGCEASEDNFGPHEVLERLEADNRVGRVTAEHLAEVCGLEVCSKEASAGA
jgi:hypothetical protein